jgi:transcription elongation factor Elf1
MQSIYKAVSDFLASLFFPKKDENPKKDEKPKILPKKQIPDGFKALHFKCWLCSGHNEFACRKFTQEKKFTIECSWCGVENVVTVFAPNT